MGDGFGFRPSFFGRGGSFLRPAYYGRPGGLFKILVELSRKRRTLRCAIARHAHVKRTKRTMTTLADDIEIPDKLCTLTECAALFKKAGKAVDRTNLGRFVDSRDFPFTQRGRSKLVNARDLFEQYAGDFTRQVMSGEHSGFVEPPKQNGMKAVRSDQTFRPPATDQANTAKDPRRREAELKVIDREMDIALRLKQVVPVEETEAAAAEAIAELRAAINRAVHEEAERIGAALNLPQSKNGLLRSELKRFARSAQEAFATRMSEHTAALEDPEGNARLRLTKLSEMSLRLRARYEPEAPRFGGDDA